MSGGMTVVTFAKNTKERAPSLRTNLTRGGTCGDTAMQSNNSSPGTYRWRECGFVGEYQYVVTVRPLSMSSDQGTERWQLSPDQYQVDVVLYHAKHTHANGIRVDHQLDFLEDDQGISLSIREWLALLRVGLRDGAPVQDDNGALWAPSGVEVEVGDVILYGEDELPENKQPRSLIVKVRNVSDGTTLSFRLGAGWVGKGYESQFNRDVGCVVLDSSRDAASRALVAATKRECDAVDALRVGAEMLHNAVAFLDEHLGGEAGKGDTGKSNLGVRRGVSTPTKTVPPPVLRRFRTCLLESAQRMETIVASASGRAAATEMGEDEDMFGTDEAKDDDVTVKPEPDGDAEESKQALDLKRRKIAGGGLKLKASRPGSETE